MASARKAYILFMARVTLTVTILMWGSLPAYVFTYFIPLSFFSFQAPRKTDLLSSIWDAVPSVRPGPPNGRFWGALSNSANLTGKLTAWYVDRDQSRIGHALWDGIVNASGPSLGWVSVDPADAGSDEDVADAIISQSAWIAVVGKFCLFPIAFCCDGFG